MTPRAAGRLAWGLAALALALLGGSVVVFLASRSVDLRTRPVSFVLDIVFAAVGAVIASRQPRNAIGWIFCGVAVLGGVSALANAYAGYWLGGAGGSRRLGETAAWVEDNGWALGVLPAVTFLLLLFPDGRLLSRRWRPIAWCAAAGIAGVFVGNSLHSGNLEDFPKVANPYGVDSPAIDALTGMGYLVLLVGLVGSVTSLILRFRRTGREQREQIKWLMWAGALAVAILVVGVAGYDLWGAGVANTAILLGVLGLPVATGMAILRHRLYDIDVVINRTLVYGALTATLALAYLGSVLLLQLLLRPLTHQSNLAIAASTLAVAALFRPARTRIQAVVDRRFYRRKYDAALTLEAFSARLRDEIDLSSLSSELRAVVTETMQPAHVSLWLPGARGTRSRS
jgi:hypothetical protein